MNCLRLPRALRSRLIPLSVAALALGFAGTAAADCIRESDRVRARQLQFAERGDLQLVFMAATTRSRNVLTGKEVEVERLPLAPFLESRRLACP